MSGFTKGPWNLTTSARLLNQWGVGDDLYLGAVCSDGFPVCIVVLDGLERTEAKANADILAAAPELYERLKEARDAIASLPEYALGGESIYSSHTGEIVGDYPIRDELLHHIDAALSSAAGEGVS